MFLSHSRNILFVGVGLAFLAGCRGDTGPSGPVMEPILAGTVRGSVQLYGDYFTGPVQNANGVTVVFQPGGFRAISLPDGSWECRNLPLGVYSIEFSKPGYFVRNLFNFQFVGSGATYHLNPVRLSVVPSVSVQLDSVIMASQGLLRFYGSIGAMEPENRVVAILFSRTSFNTTAVPIEYEASATANVPPQGVSFSGVYNLEWKSRPVFNGSTVYAVALPISNFHFRDTHPLTGRFIIDTPGVPFSAQRSVFVP